MLPDQKLTQDLARLHNQRLVLKTLYQANGAAAVSRADIARATGLTRTTVSSAVADLIEAGLVEEMGQGPSAGGKPPTLLRVIPHGRSLVTVDLAGSGIRGGIVNLHGQIMHAISLPLADPDRIQAGERTLAQIIHLVKQLIAAAPTPVLGIGIGSPGLLDARQGVIVQAVHLDWQDLPLGRLLSEHFNLPVHLVNDSQAAALAEYTFANPERATDLAVILIGRGVSAGIVLGGKLHHGALSTAASEIGHLRAVEGGEHCVCGHRGCLETILSENAILRHAHSLAPTRAPGDLAALAQAFRAGDSALLPLFTHIARALGATAATLAGVLNLPLIAIAGGLADGGDELAQAIHAEMTQRMLPALAPQVQVRFSQLGSDGVLKGAAALLLANELGIV